MARGPAVVFFLVVLATLLAGCMDGAAIKKYERPSTGIDDEDNDVFTFTIPKGTKQVSFEASTKGSPASGGTAEFMVVQEMGREPLYMARLGHGQTDRATADDPPPGKYFGIVQYDDYMGPATLDIKGGSGVALLSIGGSFWDILGVTLALMTMVGGAFLYRRHSSRLNREMERIDETFRELRVDVEQCRHELNDMQEDLRRQLMQGRLKESHYLILEKRIERYLGDLDKAVSGIPLSRSVDHEVPLEME